MSLITRTEIEY